MPEECFSVAVSPLVSCGRLGAPFARTLGYETLECVDNLETGGCTCRGTFNQQGGLAVISAGPLRTRTYSAAGSVLTTIDRGLETTYDYCVKGEQMVLTVAGPSKVGLVQGSIVLRKGQ
jgi:hypothetical protein